MFSVKRIHHQVKIHPKNLNNDYVEEFIIKTLYEDVKNKSIENIGFVTEINEIHIINTGKIIQDNGSIKFDVDFDATIVEPKIGEIIEGEVVSVIQDGIFVESKPFEIYVSNNHISGMTPYEKEKVKVKLIHYQIEDDHINCIGELVYDK